MQDNDFALASDLMPRQISKVLDQPKIRELILMIGATKVYEQVFYELQVLRDLISVDDRLNMKDSQMQFISERLIVNYPNESIADFKICFQRGASGEYGNIFRLDPIIIGDWMKKYLEEKYQYQEDKLMSEKDNMYDPIESTEIQKANTSFWLKEWENSIKNIETKAISPLSDKEIKEEGQEKPKRKVYIPDPHSLIQTQKKIRECQEKTVRERHPEFTDEEVKKYCDNL